MAVATVPVAETAEAEEEVMILHQVVEVMMILLHQIVQRQYDQRLLYGFQMVQKYVNYRDKCPV